jgi:hypothetical protein
VCVHTSISKRPIHFDSISLYLYIVYIDSEIYYRLGNNLPDCRFGWELRTVYLFGRVVAPG